MSVKKTLTRGLFKSLSSIWIASLVILTVLTITMSAGDASSATYYVSPNGSASWSSATNSSTPASANTAMSNAQAGDTVNFLSGTYYVTTTGNYEYPALMPAHSGTSGSPITFKATPGSVTIKASNPSSANSPLIGSYFQNWIVWDGFVLDTSDYPSSVGDGPVWFEGANYCTIQNSEVIGHYWSVNDNFDGIRGGASSYLTIANNKIHGFTNGVDAAGIRFFNVSYAVIQNNEIYGNSCGFHDKEGSQHNTYRYNFIHDNKNGNSYTLWIMTQNGNNVDDVQIYQNIFANNPGGINVNADAPMTITNVNWYNNDFYNAGGASIGNTSTTASNIGSSWNNITVLGNSFVFLTRGYSNPNYVDYNNYYGSSQTWTLHIYQGEQDYSSLSSWQGTSYDTSAVATNPGFLNGSGSYSLATDFQRSSYPTNGRGGSYASVMGAYITGSETIGYSSSGSSTSTSSTSTGSGSTSTTSTSDTTAPTVTSFSVPSTSSSLTIPVTMTASDNVGVTGYMITQSSTAPTASSSGWSSTAPTSYTVSSTGTYTLYAWAKDAAGNVSTSLSASSTVSTSTSTSSTSTTTSGTNECANWQTNHPEWIFCDDFESTSPFVASGRYFGYDSAGGKFTLASGAGYGGSNGMKAVWNTGDVAAGSLQLAFGQNPVSTNGIQTNTQFRDIYYRIYMKLQNGWIGDPQKLSRAIVFSGSDWSEAAIGHLWGYDATSPYLAIDPASCVTGSTVNCVGYNDFNHLVWLGEQAGTTPVYDGNHDGQWYCIEAHMKLNDPGQSNGVQEFWINGNLETSKTGLNFVGSYTTYGINAIFLENYWNNGAPQTEERDMDNFVVSTQRIGCLSSSTTTTYSITSSAGTGGSITPSGTTTVNSGSSQTYTITPASGYTVSSVTVDGSSVGAVSSYTFSNVTANHTIAASFAAQVTTYTITSSAGTGGSITPSGTTTVNSGSSQTYTITPASGYTISSVTVDGSSVGAVSSYTFSNVTANHTIAASFASSTSGTGTTTTVTLAPTSDTYLNLDSSNYSTDTQDNTYTWPADQVANAILMKFDLSGIPAGATIQSATLNLYLTSSDTSTTYTNYNLTLNKIINHNPDLSKATGYTYDGTNAWTANTTTYNSIPLAQSDITTAYDTQGVNQTAGFKKWNATKLVTDWLANPAANYGLLINSDPAAPSDTYRFFASSKNATTSLRPYLTITYSTSTSTTSTYTITSSAGTGGSITPSGTTTVNSGSSQTYTITPASGYTISSVTVDGSSVGAVSTYTFSNVTANHTIAASFAAQVTTYTITSSAGTGGSITPSGTTTVNSGSSQTYTITPASGYTISSVTVDGVSVGAVSTYTFSNVTANHTIAATFAAQTATAYTITASAGSGGSISPSGTITVKSGSSQSFTITPARRFVISNVTVDGASVGAVSSYAFSNVSANHTIAATFKKK